MASVRNGLLKVQMMSFSEPKEAILKVANDLELSVIKITKELKVDGVEPKIRLHKLTDVMVR